MNDLLKKVKTNALLSAILYTLLGLFLLLQPALSTNVLCTALGVVLVVCGIVDICIFLANRDGTLYAALHLVLGIILAALGVWLMARPTLIAVIIPRIIGVLICVHGIHNIGDAFTLHANGYPRWATALLLGVLSLALGAVLVFDPFEAFTTVIRIIGAFLIYDGVSDIWITTRVSKTLKQAARDAEAAASAQDVEFHDVQEP